jgi:hypothetical protein
VVVVLSIEAYERLQFVQETPAEAKPLDSQGSDLSTGQVAVSTIAKLVVKR